MLGCTPGDMEALVQARTLVGRHVKTVRGRPWIVCAAYVADLQAQPSEERQAIIAATLTRAAGAQT